VPFDDHGRRGSDGAMPRYGIACSARDDDPDLHDVPIPASSMLCTGGVLVHIPESCSSSMISPSRISSSSASSSRSAKLMLMLICSDCRRGSRDSSYSYARLNRGPSGFLGVAGVLDPGVTVSDRLWPRMRESRLARRVRIM